MSIATKPQSKLSQIREALDAGDEIAALRIAAELDRLASLEARLPMTKDGVIAVAGDEVFHSDWTCPVSLRVWPHVLMSDWMENCPGAKAFTDRIGGNEWPAFIVFGSYYESDTGYAESFLGFVSDCYSTEAAAEAARAQSGGGA